MSDFWSSEGAPPVLDPAQVRPSVDDVAKLERTRTVDANGQDAKTFTDLTTPTAEEVTGLIEDALAEVTAALPTNMDPIWRPVIRRLIALRTAAAIEISFFREQSTSADGYTAELAALQKLVPTATYIG